MQTYALYLGPRSTLISLPTSDTLFGAICWAVYHLWNEKKLEDMLRDFINGRPPFILSSTFPCLVKNESRVRFFPRPLLPEPTGQESADMKMKKTGTDEVDYKRGIVKASDRLKEMKKVAFVSEGLFSQIVEGRLDLKGMCQSFRKKGATSKDIEKIGNSLITYEERAKVDPESKLKSLVKEIDVQKNQVDRVVGSTVEGLLFSNKESSCKRLWFLVQTDDPDFVRPVFRYLEDTGIGGERTSGKGHFQVTEEEIISLPKAKYPNVFIVLSRYLPTEDELSFLDQGLSNWNLINIRPKRESMYRRGRERILKDPLRVFTEGSIFSLGKCKDYYGKIEDVGNMGSYVAYHNGLAVPVFAKIGGAE